MAYNEYTCFINEKKLTEEEWNKVHAKEVAESGLYYDEGFGYWHCFSYIAYSASFDRCMVIRIEERGWLREHYVKLMKAPFSDEWAEEISDFSDSFKSVYGYRPRFIDDMLLAKGKTRKDLHEAWERLEEAYIKNSTTTLVGRDN